MSEFHPRNFVGYGEHPPRVEWPGGARVALNFVLNYEEGAENTILNGDEHSEIFIHEVPAANPIVGQRNLNTESAYEYGARAGVWRILRVFENAGLPLTVFAVGKALQENPDVGRAFARLGHEVASHHWRWIDYLNMPEDEEREHLRQSIDIIRELTGTAPAGWYGGRTSPNSRRLAMEAGCFRYDSDVYDDDLPHWIHIDGKPLLLLPYAFDTNDFKFTLAPGFQSGNDFESYLRSAFDFLYDEGSTTPRMMSVALHCRVTGRPGRAAALARFLDYVQSKPDVWVCRRVEIADHWIANYPATG